MDDLPGHLGAAPCPLRTSESIPTSPACSDGNSYKIGLDAKQTRLDEDFSLGVTAAGYNSPCLRDGDPAPSPALRDPSDCRAPDLAPNPDFLAGLLPYDLTRGGAPYQFKDKATISQVAYFAQDSITMGNLTLNVGLRVDHYNGLTRGDGVQPRGAFSYLFKPTRTVIRAGYSRTTETPVNENLVVSSSTGSGGLASNLFKGTAEQRPIELGRPQSVRCGNPAKHWQVDGAGCELFRKYTRNAYDFDAMFSAPITFPIGWKESKLDGVFPPASAPSTFMACAFTRPWGTPTPGSSVRKNGGIIFNSNLTVGAYRQDHDQVYQQNVNIHSSSRRARGGRILRGAMTVASWWAP